MFNVGSGELLVILFVALVVLGPETLADSARKLGNFVGEARRMSQGFQDDVQRAMTASTAETSQAVGSNDPTTEPPPPKDAAA